MGVCNCSKICCALLYVPSSFAIILMGKREPVALLSLSSWCLVIVEWLFLAVSWVCLQMVIAVFPDHTHYFCATMAKQPTCLSIKELRKCGIAGRTSHCSLFRTSI